jgi:hypothetical protein
MTDENEQSIPSRGSHMVGPAPVERLGSTKVADVGGAGPANVACDTKQELP